MAIGNIIYSTSSTTITTGGVIDASDFERSTNLQVDTTSGNLSISGGINTGGVSNLTSNSNVKISGGSNGQVLSTDGSGNLSWTPGVSFATNLDVQSGTSTTLAVTPSSLRGSGLVISTVLTPTSGTTVSFVVPTWAKRITVMFNELTMSTSNASLQLRLGADGAPENTNYYGAVGYTNGGNGAGASSWSDSMVIGAGDNASGITFNGSAILTRFSSVTNTWVLQSIVTDRVGEILVWSAAGSKTLSAAPSSYLTVQVLITGTSTFSSGSINIMHE